MDGSCTWWLLEEEEVDRNTSWVRVGFVWVWNVGGFVRVKACPDGRLHAVIVKTIKRARPRVDLDGAFDFLMVKCA